LGKPFDPVPLDQVDDEADPDLGQGGHAKDADAAYFKEPGDGRRGAGEKGAAAGGEVNPVVGDEPGALIDEAGGQI